MIPVGVAFGILEITIAAFAAEEGQPELAGVLLTLWAVASAAGGLVYGARPRRSTASDAHLRIALLLPLGLAPVTLATSPEVDGAAAPPGRHLHRAAARDAQRARGHRSPRRGRRPRPTPGR